MPVRIERVCPPETAKLLSQGIVDFNRAAVRDLEPNEAELRFHVVATDDQGQVIGGLRGTFGADWNWDTAVLYNKSEKNEVTRNRPANSLLAEALFDPTPAAYNPWGGGGARPTNIERVLVDVRRVHLNVTSSTIDNHAGSAPRIVVPKASLETSYSCHI